MSIDQEKLALDLFLLLRIVTGISNMQLAMLMARSTCGMIRATLYYTNSQITKDMSVSSISTQQEGFTHVARMEFYVFGTYRNLLLHFKS